MFLFEKILLCCKPINPNKQKAKMMKQPPPLPKGKTRLQLKGRIFMANVTETQIHVKNGMNGSLCALEQADLLCKNREMHMSDHLERRRCHPRALRDMLS